MNLGVVLLPLRVFLGFISIYAGMGKLCDPVYFDGGERGSLRDAHTAQGGREMREKRHLLLPALQALQARVGWVSEGGLSYVCERLSVPPAEAWGVATFYALIATEPRPQRCFANAGYPRRTRRSPRHVASRCERRSPAGWRRRGLGLPPTPDRARPALARRVRRGVAGNARPFTRCAA